MSLNPRRSNVFDLFSLDVRHPFEGWPFSSNFRSLSYPIGSGYPAETSSSILQTRVDWKETPNAHVFKADVPGMKKEQLKVEVEDGRILQISGQRSHELEEKTDSYHRKERCQGSFMRRFRLPDDAKMDQVKAAMEDGVLTVTIPKEVVKKADVKSIQISG